MRIPDSSSSVALQSGLLTKYRLTTRHMSSHPLPHTRLHWNETKGPQTSGTLSAENTVAKTGNAHQTVPLTAKGHPLFKFTDNLAKQNAWQAMELKILQHNWRQADEQGPSSDTTGVDRLVTWHKPCLPLGLGTSITDQVLLFIPPTPLFPPHKKKQWQLCVFTLTPLAFCIFSAVFHTSYPISQELPVEKLLHFTKEQ